MEARFAFRPAGVVERAQRRRLGAVVGHAYEHVPYYRETMRRLGLAPGDIAVASDLAKLPLIEREQLQRDPEYFVSRAEPRGELLELRSGGSTGEPISVFRHPFALFQGAAYRERIRSPIMRLARKRVRFREALIALPDKGARQEFGRRTLIPSSVRVVRARFSMLSPLQEVVDGLNEFRPDVIATYGSYLEALFGHLLESGAACALPRVAVYSSDALSDQARTLITEHFGIEVLSVYRAVEASQIGFECERHEGHHLNVDLCPVRIVDPEGVEVDDGEPGEVVTSNLYARGTILLNYRLGDLAAKLPRTCSCGRSLPLLSSVRGRTDEWLAGPDGERIHGQAIRNMMRGHHEVLRYQFVQERVRSFRAAVIVKPGTDRDALVGSLEAGLRERFGAGVELRASFPAELPRTAGGKTKPVVSLVARQGATGAQRI